MPPEAFASFLRLALVVFVFGLVLTERGTYAEIVRRGSPESGAPPGNVRDELVEALGRGGLRGLAVSVLAAIAWGAVGWSRYRWEVAIAAEILLAFAVLEVGMTAFSVRLALGMAERGNPASVRRVLPVLRLGMIVTGALYGVAVCRWVSGGPGETLFAVFTLGAALAVLGLNRTAQMPTARLALLALALGKR
jgi:hypothetical protein